MVAGARAARACNVRCHLCAEWRMWWQRGERYPLHGMRRCHGGVDSVQIGGMSGPVAGAHI